MREPPPMLEPGDVAQNVLVPIKLDAFIFNRPVFEAADQPPKPKPDDDKKDPPVYAKMAPINQPNYTFLRLDKDYIQSDILNPIDLYNSWPAQFNSRFTDLGTGQERVRRQGVYLHWTIPRMYRSGIATTENNMEDVRQERLARGLQVDMGDDALDSPEEPPKRKIDPTVPSFPNVPTRWMVIRHLHPGTAVPAIDMPEFTGWIIESDRKWNLDDIPGHVDLQVDVSPFIAASGGAGVEVSKQAEVFIGDKRPLEGWEEPDTPGHEPEGRRIRNFSLLNSSNQLFADYQPHCSNVFSMVDNFEYGRGGQFLDKATASYYVIGWHSKEQEDLFWGDAMDPKVTYTYDEKEEKEKRRLSRRQRLDALKLTIKLDQAKKDKDRRKTDDFFKNWLDAKDETHVVCHGAMYNVQWDRHAKPKTPADAASHHLNYNLPVAVGTTPMDSLMTFAHAHEATDPKETAELEELILRLETHLLARDDGVESQQQAQDLLYNWNYLRSDGGQVWNVAGKDSNEPVAGTPALLDTLRKLNREQMLYDATTRALGRLRWEMFSEWWLHVTDKGLEDKKEQEKKDRETQERVGKLGERIRVLEEQEKGLKAKIGSLSQPKTLEAGARPPFYQQRDPTLLVGGIKAGWPHDYLDKLQVRLDSQIVTDKEWKTTPRWENLSTWTEKFRPRLQPTIRRLFKEFCSLNPAFNKKDPDLEKDSVQEMPLFHDDLSGTLSRGPWRDRWESQPWFPLFMEWEVEYNHIPYEQWTLEDRRSRSSNVDQTRYGIPPANKLADTPPSRRDRQRIDGRALILPQPSFSLEAKIRQLYESTPSRVRQDIDGGRDKPKDFLNEEEWKTLKDNLHQLTFLSAPLSGLTAHLTTVLQGSHIKPLLREADTGAVIPIREATRDKAGFTEQQLGRIGIMTDDTPFGAGMKPSTTDYPLFKPVTHGQFKITRLNIIDKFGQAIHAIDPTPKSLQKVWPCIGEWYAPQLAEPSEDDPTGRRPNVFEPTIPDHVETPDELAKPQPCEFVQMPPQINQLARLNVTFVKRDKDEEGKVSPFWRPADEWDNPIWGWVVINYANQGIQLFMPDGCFYREVRVAGPGNAQTGPEWLPFQAPRKADKNADWDATQLQLLCKQLGDEDFLKSFWTMVVEATNNMLPAPDAYAGFSNALIGRPLALANAGWSLELGVDEMSTRAAGDEKKRKPYQLLPNPDRKKKEKNPVGGVQSSPFAPPEQYSFPLKIGDKKRGFDGLVGYFPCRDHFKRDDKSTQTDLGLALHTIRSHYAPDQTEDPGQKTTTRGGGPTIIKPEHIQMKAFWTSPEHHTDGRDYVWARNDELEVYGLLLDPFSPVHTYSGILPVRELQLPAWTWQGAMAKMKAFFHAGPIIVTKDVPEALPAGYELKEPVNLPAVSETVKPVALPAVGSGDWAWLQPYGPEDEMPPTPGPPPPQPPAPPAPPGSLSGGPVEGGPTGGGDEKPEVFAALPVTVEDERARFETGPYTALEGYVLMVSRGEGKKPSP